MSKKVHVKGYYRSSGTYVAPHTRSAPTARGSGASSSACKSRTSSSSSCFTSGSTGVVNVGGYTRSNGTYVAPHTRSAPRKPSSSSSLSAVNVSSHSTGTCAAPSSIKAAPRSTASSSSGKCYVDNAHNRRLGRVGKPIPKRYIRQREIIERNTEQEIILHLQTLSIRDPEHEITQSAIDRLHQQQIEKMWGDKNIISEASELSTVGVHTIPYKDLDIKEEIGHGVFGIVSACLWKGKLAAYKIFIHQQMSRRAQRDFGKEIEVLVNLDHPHTVKMYGAVLEEGYLGFVMEYMSRTLFQALFNDITEFEDEKKIKIIFQLASALEYLHTHEREIAHCDIKSQNVLLDHSDNAKLCDFGLSSMKSVSETSQSSVQPAPARGTPRYSAPEVLRGEFLSKPQLLKTDIYSLAVCVFEIVTEEEPFYGLTLRQLEAQVGRENLHPSSDVTLSDQLSAFLMSCWDSKAENRPTATCFIEEWKKIDSLLV